MSEVEQLSPDGERALDHFEGTVLHVYRDQAGKWTIGRGHLCSPAEMATGLFAGGVVAEKDAQGRWTITRDQADFLARRDVRTAAEAVARLVTVPLEPHQRDMLISFTFNEGVGRGEPPWGTGLAGSTLLRKLNAGNYGAVPSELLRWDKRTDENGHLVPDASLAKRRHAEGEIWTFGYGHPVAESALAVAAREANRLRFDLIALARAAEGPALPVDRDTLPDGEPLA